MYFVVCVLLAIITVGDCAQKRSIGDELLQILDLSKCGYQIEAVRCYKDFPKHRILPDEILNSRSKTSRVYEGPIVQWENYNHWLANFICKCATKMLDMKKVDTDYIGIEFFGECWINLEKNITAREVETFVNINDCHGGNFQQYSPDSSNCEVFTGNRFTTFIYKVRRIRNEENDCPFFTSKGCFKDNIPRDRPEDKPLPEYVMNERDSSIPNWNNHSISWKNWDDGYLNEMICRCAKRAKEMKKRFFGIQFYAECWVGDDEDKIDQHGMADTCVDNTFRPTCSTDSNGQCPAKLCAGQAFSTMVYELHQGPLGCLKNPCGADESCIPNGVNEHECVNK